MTVSSTFTSFRTQHLLFLGVVMATSVAMVVSPFWLICRRYGLSPFWPYTFKTDVTSDGHYSHYNYFSCMGTH